MTYYQELRVKLPNKQLNKLKSAAKNKARTILKINKNCWIVSNNKTNN